MDGIMIQLDRDTEKALRDVFPVYMSTRDMEFAVDWILRVGVKTIQTALEKNPELTLGDLISRFFRIYDN